MRRRYITHPRFQFLFVLAYVRGALFSVAGGAILLFTMLYFLAQDAALRPEQAVKLTESMATLGWCFLIIASVTILLCLFLGIYLSYKMAGPIRRMEDWLVHKNTEEDVAELHLRPGDEWIPVVEILNRLTNRQQ